MSWPKDFEVYQRHPIRISHHAVILLHIFKRSDHLEDAWTWDNESMQEHDSMSYQLAAEQFKKQLEGHDCIAFWQELKIVAEREIQDWEDRCAEIDKGEKNEPIAVDT